MRTAVPGPVSISHIEDLKRVQECSAVHFFLDYEKSYGNYIIDAVRRLIARMHLTAPYADNSIRHSSTIMYDAAFTCSHTILMAE